MENATSALLTGFAVFIFLIALTLSLNSLNQAKTAADVVLHFSDRENFQTPLKSGSETYNDGGRTVQVDTVIATISRCAKEKFSVKIIDGSGTYKFEYDVQTENEIREKINDFIDKHTGANYRETYVEVTTSGTTYIGEDGTELQQDVGKKMYITYSMI